MGARKIQDEGEIVRWFEEGRTYAWMRDEYRRKYHLEVGLSMFSNFRIRRGLDRRIVRDAELIPWQVKPEHRYGYAVSNLRFEARRRAGVPLSPREQATLDGWLRNVRASGVVVHYDPDTEAGWFYVEPRPGVDTDLIRVPDARRRVA